MQITYSLNREQYLEFYTAFYKFKNNIVSKWQGLAALILSVIALLFYKAYGNGFGLYVVIIGFVFIVLNLRSNLKNSATKGYLAFIDTHFDKKISLEHTATIKDGFLIIQNKYELVKIDIKSINEIRVLSTVCIVTNELKTHFIFGLEKSSKAFIDEISKLSGIEIKFANLITKGGEKDGCKYKNS